MHIHCIQAMRLSPGPSKYCFTTQLILTSNPKPQARGRCLHVGSAPHAFLEIPRGEMPGAQTPWRRCTSTRQGSTPNTGASAAGAGAGTPASHVPSHVHGLDHGQSLPCTKSVAASARRGHAVQCVPVLQGSFSSQAGSCPGGHHNWVCIAASLQIQCQQGGHARRPHISRATGGRVRASQSLEVNTGP